MFEFMMSQNIKLNLVYSKEEYKAQADILRNEINKMLVDEVEFLFPTDFGPNVYCVVKSNSKGYYIQLHPGAPDEFKNVDHYQEWRYRTYVQIYIWLKDHANNYNKHFNALFNKIKLDPIPTVQADKIDIPVKESVIFNLRFGDGNTPIPFGDDSLSVQSQINDLAGKTLTITGVNSSVIQTSAGDLNHSLMSGLSGPSSSCSTVTNNLDNLEVKVDKILDILIPADKPQIKEEIKNEVKQPVEYRRPVSINRNQDRVSRMIQSFRRNRMTK